MRLIKRAGDEAIEDTHRRTVHGSPHKGKLSTLGGAAMGRDAKPSGFLFKDAGRPRRSGERP